MLASWKVYLPASTSTYTCGNFPHLTHGAFYVFTILQIWAFALGVYNRITCANPDNAWNLVCPVWPLGMLFCLLIVSAINTTIYWAFYL